MAIVMSEWATFDELLLEAEQCLEAIRDTLVAGPTETQVHGIVQYLEGVIEAISMVETSLPDTELSPFLDAVKVQWNDPNYGSPPIQ